MHSVLRVIERNLLHTRGLIVPLGMLFVALCPVVNFWSQHLPGSDVVKSVHVFAATCLFVGGTATETLRLYFLWCESRAAGMRRCVNILMKQ